ncbi:MAG: hypothetical protein Ct9H300mP1_11190 [Planctomycetaceae bacterium]|nr:MAG: hypothetical protein Ct9H300mP1_11190 [Planctomycetaceae bacterium]
MTVDKSIATVLVAASLLVLAAPASPTRSAEPSPPGPTKRALGILRAPGAAVAVPPMLQVPFATVETHRGGTAAGPGGGDPSGGDSGPLLIPKKPGRAG